MVKNIDERMQFSDALAHVSCYHIHKVSGNLHPGDDFRGFACSDPRNYATEQCSPKMIYVYIKYKHSLVH